MRVINKDLLREIRKTKAKFLSITIIMFLGVFVFIGLNEVPSTMNNTLNKYLLQSNMYDIKVSNDMLMSQEDVKYLQEIPEISNTEVYYQAESKDDKYRFNIKIQSLNENIAKPKLIDGRLPSNSSEIVLTEALSDKYQVGDIVKFSDLKDSKISLKNLEYKVVGFVYGIDFPENSTNNKSNVNFFGYVQKENFSSDSVNGITILLRNIDRTDLTTDSYYDSVNKHRDSIIQKLESLQKNNDYKIRSNTDEKLQEDSQKILDSKEKLNYAYEQMKNLPSPEYENQKQILDNQKIELENQEQLLNTYKKQMETLTYPKYNVESIKGNSYYKQFIESAKSLLSISNIFSIFLFSVSILVSLTTISRMVDENRTNMGTLKSLGYSNFQVSRKYYIYGFLSTLIGGIIGTILSYLIIVPIIYDSYANLLTLKNPQLVFTKSTIFMAIFISIICVILAVTLPIYRNLKESPSNLLRPKSPKEGSRVFLEYLPFIWRKLSFLHKVTFRNIFRYKVRMLMTILGVLGCTALMFIGFGIKFSVMNVSNEQFNNITKYDLAVTYNPYILDSDRDKILEVLGNKSNVESSKEIQLQKATIQKDNDILDNLSMIVSKGNLQDYIILKNNDGVLDHPKDGAIINEKLSYLYDLSVGSTIDIVVDDKSYSVKVSGISKNYFGHTIYISDEYYEQLFQKDYMANSFLVKNYNDKAKVEEVVSLLEKDKNVVNILNQQSFKETFDNFVDGIDVIVLVIVLCSVTLAIVVLYNLININLSERIRELSTIKVLGFYSKEVTIYVFREIFYLTLIGIALGNYVGYVMYKKIILDLSARDMLFETSVSMYVYIITSIITLTVTSIIMVIVHRYLKNINMIEALKSVE
ncbi:FtsX-like permease family protein [Gemella sp. GH3]|nr:MULTISPECIES: ABC transporter permease [unclassified Gemella]MBF0714095.1 FtsX-like permease family protein [Gemella sp. GH3.1]NYS51047.1 FtsX-like permease family protein [Gemella sp. GH3]